jgi:hypothetical protein
MRDAPRQGRHSARGRRPTIDDVARHAGVSKGAVSLALDGVLLTDARIGAPRYRLVSELELEAVVIGRPCR